MKKFWNFMSGKKSYLGAGILIACGLSMGYLLISYGYDNGIAWKLVETFVTIGLGLFGVGARHALKKIERQTDRRGDDLGPNKGRRKND